MREIAKIRCLNCESEWDDDEELEIVTTEDGERVRGCDRCQTDDFLKDIYVVDDRRLIIYVGDPHGKIDFLLEASLTYPNATFILLGDLQFSTDQFVTLLASMNVLLIHGNHDTDKDEWTYLTDRGFPNITNMLYRAQLSVKIAGLGGIFRDKVWNVREEKITYRSRDEHWDSLQKNQSLPRKNTSTIYPEDVESLLSSCEGHNVDVLVTHEAPKSSGLKGGFQKIDDVAIAIGAPVVIHGHHHISYREDTEFFTCFGVGMREFLIYDVLKKEYKFDETRR